MEISNGKVKVTRPTTITFQLSNLSAGTQFAIQAEGSKDSKSTGKKEIQFAVGSAEDRWGSPEYPL
jgi:hypothetical protein